MTKYHDKHQLIDMTLLYIEENSERRLYYTKILKGLCSKVFVSSSVDDAIQQSAKVCPDIILTDIGIKDKHGVTIIERLREQESDLPLIVLSVCEEVSCFQRAIELHVSAYLLHPVSAEELKSSFCRVMKKCRQESEQNPIVLDDNLQYQESIKSLIYEGSQVTLNKKEARLLEYLIKYKNVLLSYEDIKRHIWPGGDVSSASLRTLIKNLRKKGMMGLIQNVSGRGYLLKLSSP